MAALPPAFHETLGSGLAAFGLELTAGTRAALDAQARLLLAWNRFINLTGLRTPEQVARGHLLDSLAAVRLLRRRDGQRLLDLGSGGGYPGLPLALTLPATRAALVDSVAKKAAFLEVAVAAAAAALREAGEQPPELVVLAERAEDLADEPEHREAWDLVVARAVGSVAEVAELALPLLRIGGRAVAWKRRSPDGSLEAELRQAGDLLRTLGATPPRIEDIAGIAEAGLPDHVLVVIGKTRSTPDRYPRQPTERRRALLG